MPNINKGSKTYATMSNWQRGKYLSNIISKGISEAKREDRDAEKDMTDLLNNTTIEENTTKK
jgi:hypothetical protein